MNVQLTEQQAHTILDVMRLNRNVLDVQRQDKPPRIREAYDRQIDEIDEAITAIQLAIT